MAWRRYRGWAFAVLLTVQAVALVALVARGGTAWWAAFRAVSVVAVTALLGAGMWAGGPGWRAACCVIAGIGGVIVGGGIGAGHVANGVVSADAVLGLIVLCTGVVLLGAGTVLALRAIRGWWRLLAVLVGYVVVQFFMLPAGVAVYTTNVPPTTVGADTPARYGLSYEDVRFPAADGVVLSAWYLPSGTRAAVVLLHGAGNTRTDVLDQASVLARHGFGVLMPDARGHGRSGGHAMDLGWYGVADITGAVSYLAGRPDVDPARIGAVGESMGGEEAITAAAADDRIKAVVGEGVTARVAADAAWLPRRPAGLITSAEFAVTSAVADVLSTAPKPVPLRSAVAAVDRRPLMLIASGARGEIDAARYYRAAAAGSVQVWELPDTGHTQGLTAHREEWTARVTGFLDGALLAAA